MIYLSFSFWLTSLNRIISRFIHVAANDITVQLLSHVWPIVTHGLTAANQPSLFFTVSYSLLKFMSIELVMLSISSKLSPFPFASIFPSLRFLQWISSSHQVAEVLELQLQSFHEYSGLISFRIDWFDLLSVQGSLRSLLKHNMKASALWCSAFFMV